MKFFEIGQRFTFLTVGLVSLLAISACSSGGTDGGGGTPPAAPPASVTLTIANAGSGTGTITSSPAGLNCGNDCLLTVSSGTVITLTAAPASGNTLASWGGTCATASATCAVTVTSNLTVTATFNTSTATPALTITNAGTGSGTVTCAVAACDPTYPWGTSVTLSGVPQAGSSFAGWSGGGCTGMADCTVLLWDNTTVTGTFNTIPVTASLTVTKNGTGAGTVTSSPAGINCGATCSSNFPGGTSVTLTASATAGSTFVGWSGGGCSGTGPCVVTLNANTTVTATVDILPPTVTLGVTTAGTGTGTVTCNGGPCNPSYPSGTVLTVAATPAASSIFGGWGGACSAFGTTPTCTVTLNADSTISATFNLPTLSVVLAGTGSVTSSPAGINCGSICTAAFHNGTSVTLSATGAGFTGWSGGGCAGTGTCVVTLSQNITVTATFGGGLPPFAQQAYLKASNTGAGDVFGTSVALNGDTLVVGARYEASNATGVNGNQADNSMSQSGAVYVFTRTSGVWSQQAYLKASNTGASDQFGYSVALSGDTLVVGAYLEDSSATGVNGDQGDDFLNGVHSGAAYVFTRTAGVWSQQAYLKASNTGAFDEFGRSVALNGDTLVVGAISEDSSATGVNGDQGQNPPAFSSGAAYVFTRTSGVWSQQAYLKASNTGPGDEFGWSVALNGDTLVVGADGEASNAAGVNGDQANNNAPGSGAAYVFTRTAGVWSQQAYLKASNTPTAFIEGADRFGYSVALAGDTVVVGAWGEDSNATGVNGDQANNSSDQSGAAYVFTRTGGVWSQQAYLKASNTDTTPSAQDHFGWSVALSGDRLVVGAHFEASSATGVNGDQANNNAGASGAAYVFTRTSGVWSQQAYLKASNTGTFDRFGESVALDGNTLVVGAIQEDSNATGVNGNQADNSVGDSGAAYVFVAQ